MYDIAKCLFLSGTITLFANVPEMFEWPIEKIGFGALLFFIIWTYMKTILPKTQADIDDKNKRIECLIAEIAKLNELRAKDQIIIAALLREVKQNPVMGGNLSLNTIQERINLDDLDKLPEKK